MTELAKSLFTKDFNLVDEDERIVEGYITDDSIDIDGHIIDKDGFKSALEDYLSWGNIRDQHGLPVGKVIGMADWNRISVKIVDDSVWKKIKAGLYKGFSIGIRVLGIEVEDVAKYADSSFAGLPQLVVKAIRESGVIIRITKMVLAEVSIVDRPANPRALVTSIKNMKSDASVPFVPVIGSIIKAQNSEGEIQMENETQQVDTQLDETNVETEIVEKDAANVEGQGVVDFESRVASLEKSVTDLVGVVTQINGTVDTQLKTMQDTLAKALEGLKQAQVAETVTDVPVETATVVDVKSVEVDTEKQVADLVTKAIADIQAAVTKSVDEAVKKLVPTESADNRVGGVNGGEQDEDTTTLTKGTESKKVTYKDAAIAVAARFGATI